MRVLLANPQSVLKNDLGQSVIYDRGFGEHLGIRYLASVLERDGHHVKIVDCHFERLNQQELEDACSTGEYDICGISFVEPLLEQTVSLARLMRQAHPRAVLLIGGYGATFVGSEVMRRAPGIDAAVIGEAEITLARIVKRVVCGEDWRHVPGLLYLEQGREVATGPAQLVDDLDTIPWPRRGSREQHDRRAHRANILASRGCHGRCTYCSIIEFYRQSEGRHIRIRRPEAVVDEMEHLHHHLGVSHFDFLDDNFTEVALLDASWAGRFVHGIKRRGLRVSWGMQCRATEVREDLFRLLYTGGLRIVSLGIETDVTRLMNLFRKGTTKEKNRQAIRTLQRLGIHMYIEMIMFEPTTALAEVRENIAFLEEIQITENYRQPPVSTYRALALYHGLPVTDQMKQLGLVWSDGTFLRYRFLDPKVALLNDILERWQYISGDVIRLHNEYLHYQASASGRFKTSLSAVKLCKAYLDFDLGFFKSAIEFAGQRPEATKSEQEDFLNQYKGPMLDFLDGYRQIQAKINAVVTHG